jgi:5-methyltetrahydropteroyltriglutamate--homocysteine methyltransferase
VERSEGRLLTTHAGSLPRPPRLTQLLAALNRGQPVDEHELSRLVDAAVASAVDKQRAVGIDVGNDGEQGRESFFTYVQHRMTGFSPGVPGRHPARQWQDIVDFPGFGEIRQGQRAGEHQVTLATPPVAVGPVAYGDTAAIDAECARLGAAASDHPFTDVFLSSPSPGIVTTGMANTFYAGLDEYLEAVAVALSTEYHRIVAEGFVLQIDAPDLAMERHALFRDKPLEDFLDFVDRVVGAINTATEGIPPERIRLHVCWGNYGGPHTHDVPLRAILPHLYQAHVGGLLLSLANPRHAHEHRELRREPLPDGWLVAAGVIDTTTNYVEHPEVVADRLERVVDAVGDPHRVLASTDCGFDTAAGFGLVAADVAWEKLRSLRAGADLASSRVF